MGDCKKKMSALQTFLLVVDHNKEEAKEIAERVAHGELHTYFRSNCCGSIEDVGWV